MSIIIPSRLKYIVLYKFSRTFSKKRYIEVSLPYVNFVNEKVSFPFGELVSFPLVNSHVNVVVVDVRMENPPGFIVNTDFCSEPFKASSEFITKSVPLFMVVEACFQTNVPGVVNPVTVQVITSSKAVAVVMSAIVVIPEFNIFEN